jgi:hypothetical protein
MTSVVQAVEDVATALLVINELEKYGRKRSCPAVSHRPGICLEGQTKTTGKSC